MSEGFEPSARVRLRREAMKGGGVLAVLVLLMLWLAGGFIDKVQPGPPLSKPQAPKFSTRKVERRVFPLVIDQVGTIRAQSEAEVSSRIMAQVREILVREGDVVSGGDAGGTQATPLARLDARDFRAKLHQAEQQVAAMNSAVESAEAKLGAARAQLSAAAASRDKSLSDYRRYQDLYRNQAATGQQLEHMRAQRDVAEAQAAATRKELQAAEGDLDRTRALKSQAEAGLAEARVMLSHAMIRAPFSGRVVKKLIDTGDMVTPGQSMFVIDTASRPEIHAFLSESLLPHLKVGQEMEAHVDAIDKTAIGTLKEIVPKSDPNTRTIQVKVSLEPDPALVNGFFARLRVVHGKYDALVVPLKSVRQVGQLHLVDVLGMDGHPQRRFVTLGKTHAELIEVLSGLGENEEIVIP